MYFFLPMLGSNRDCFLRSFYIIIVRKYYHESEKQLYEEIINPNVDKY